MNFTFLTEEQFNNLDIFIKRGTKTAITDFEILLVASNLLKAFNADETIARVSKYNPKHFILKPFDMVDLEQKLLDAVNFKPSKDSKINVLLIKYCKEKTTVIILIISLIIKILFEIALMIVCLIHQVA